MILDKLFKFTNDFKVRKIFMYKKYSLDNNFRGKAGYM